MEIELNIPQTEANKNNQQLQPGTVDIKQIRDEERFLQAVDRRWESMLDERQEYEKWLPVLGEDVLNDIFKKKVHKPEDIALDPGTVSISAEKLKEAFIYYHDCLEDVDVHTKAELEVRMRMGKNCYQLLELLGLMPKFNELWISMSEKDIKKTREFVDESEQEVRKSMAENRIFLKNEDSVLLTE